MQISAANLLLAGQQLRHADGGRAAGDAFARALGQGEIRPGTVAQSPAGQIKGAPFTPPDLTAETAAAAPSQQTAAAPAGTTARPGSRLDIRV